jgi:hypothetical protein
VFGSIVNVTAPLPVTVGALVTAIHGAPDTTDHVHPAVVTTSNVPAPASADVVLPVADSAKVQGAACVIVTVLPAIVAVAMRAAVVVLAATFNETLPLPVPDPVPVTVTHGALTDVDQLQVAPAVTVTVTLSPAASVGAVAGDTVGVHVPVPLCGRIVASSVRGPGAAVKYVSGLKTI